MKTLLFILFVITVSFVNYSIEQNTDGNEITTQETEMPISTTTPWWTRTFPVIPHRTVPERPRPPPATTTNPNRVSTGVSIAVPLVLFILTLSIGFGLIIYSVKRGHQGMSWLTPTNDPVAP
ncbi:unnamed protein product [Adineta steineri]|uniref:Uncharacterized protein n=1 Tax=Adineta steineri TaxID=433720 RepID=A0A814CKT1_9BILA|nr:unnamed protein product [Adineta steineri]CAF0945942.1 unnamed protein product [Adineta steineri]